MDSVFFHFDQILTLNVNLFVIDPVAAKFIDDNSIIFIEIVQ